MVNQVKFKLQASDVLANGAVISVCGGYVIVRVGVLNGVGLS